MSYYRIAYFEEDKAKNILNKLNFISSELFSGNTLLFHI